jgi:anti-sigma-K factor RskA
MLVEPGHFTSHITRRLAKKSQTSAWRAKLVLLAVFSNVAVTHSVPFVESKFSSPSRAVLRNSFSFPVHQPNELVHLSESPDVQKRVPFGIFNPEKIKEIS